MLILVNYFITVVLTLIGYESLFSDLFNQENKWKLIFDIALLSFIIAVLITIARVAYVNRKYNFESDNLKLSLSRGNLFEIKEGTIIIPVDSNYEDYNYQETNFIAPSTLQYQFMSSIYEVENKKEFHDYYDVFFQGQTKYILFKVGELDEGKRLYLDSMGSYIDLLYRLSKIINDIERNETFYLPVIGGRMRFNKEINALSSQNRLNLLVTVLKMHRFEQKTKIHIVVYNTSEEDYKFDEL